jgi:hypothetical protein
MAIGVLFYLLVFGAIAAGFLLVTGRVRPESGIVYKVVGAVTGRAPAENGLAYKVVGAVLVVAGVAVFGATIRRWSGYFFAFCLLAAVRALFALLVGHTMSRLVVDRMHAAEFFGLLVVMLFLSYRYVGRPPHTALESICLVAAVVGLAGGIAFDPSIWPVAWGALLLALPLLARKQKSRATA